MGNRDEKILHQIGEEYPITICICQCWIAHFVESTLSFTLLHSNALDTDTVEPVLDYLFLKGSLTILLKLKY